MSSTPSINVARLTYLLICEAAGVAIAMSTRGSLEIPIWVGVVGGLVVAGLFIWIETLIRGFTLRGFSTATFGLGVGLLCAWLLTRVEISSLLALAIPENPEYPENRDIVVSSMRLAIDIGLYSSLGFLGAVLAIRTNHYDFAFVIPYVRFRQDASTGPVILDAETVIDIRLPGIVRAGFLSGRLVVPSFVLEELQRMTESSSNGTKLRGQRGLDAVAAMQKSEDIEISVEESRSPFSDEKVSSRLIETTKILGGRLMSVDPSLGKVAKLQGLQVINIEQLEQALKPPAAIGDKVRITLVRNGKEDHQAVGYLPDGTMIVVNHGIAKIGSSVEVTVVSTLQTSAGTMVFSELVA